MQQKPPFIGALPAGAAQPVRVKPARDINGFPQVMQNLSTHQALATMSIDGRETALGYDVYAVWNDDDGSAVLSAPATSPEAAARRVESGPPTYQVLQFTTHVSVPFVAIEQPTILDPDQSPKPAIGMLSVPTMRYEIILDAATVSDLVARLAGENPARPPHVGPISV